jgi:hypothetical protein
MALPLHASTAIRRFGALVVALLPLHAGCGDRLFSDGSLARSIAVLVNLSCLTGPLYGGLQR